MRSRRPARTPPGWASTGLIVVCIVAGTFPAAAEARRMLYVTGNPSGAIAALDITTASTPVAVSGSPFSSPDPKPESAAITPDGSRLFVTAGAALDGLTIAADGSLSPTPGARIELGPASLDLAGIAITPDGRRLYVALAEPDPDGSIRGFEIAASGSMAAIPGSTVPVDDPAGIAIAPGGGQLYVAEQGQSRVRGYSIGPSGSLSAVAGANATTPGPLGLTAGPDGDHLYATNPAAGSISAFAIAADGSLSAVAHSPFSTAAGTVPAWPAAAPDGRHLYATDAGPGVVHAFTIDLGGGLAALPSAPGPPSASIAATPDSRQLFVPTTGGAKTAYGYEIAADGTLTQVAAPLQTNVENAGIQGAAIVPDQGPAAAFTASPLPAGFPSIMDGTASSDPDGSVARFAWDFGDGTTLVNGNPSPSHTYTAPGNYTVRLTVTDNEGCSSVFVYTGQTASCNGGGKATTSSQVTITDGTAPSLSLSGRRKQKLDSAIEVGARCSEDCRVTGRGTLVVSVPEGEGRATALSGKRRTFALKKRGLSLVAGAKGTLKLRVAGKGRKAAAKALQAGGPVLTRINVSAEDNAGNRARQKRRITLKPNR